MHARVGDRLVVEGVHVGVARRVGLITGVRHADGTPPYEVRWLDDGHVSVVHPGPESHLEPAADELLDALIGAYRRYGPPEVVNVMENWQALLRRAREVGVDAAFAQAGAGQGTVEQALHEAIIQLVGARPRTRPPSCSSSVPS